VSGRIAGPNHKINIVLQIFFNPAECLVHQGQG
jgi:hypothetical protein